MNSAYGSSVSFGSIVKTKYIGNNTYAGRRSNLRSKPTPINIPVHKYDLNFSYSTSHFSWLPQEVSKGLINFVSKKVSYAYMMIVPIINGFSRNKIKRHLQIYDNSIITFGIRRLYLRFSKNYHVDSLHKFRKTVVDKAKFDISI